MWQTLQQMSQTLQQHTCDKMWVEEAHLWSAHRLCWYRQTLVPKRASEYCTARFLRHLRDGCSRAVLKTMAFMWPQHYIFSNRRDRPGMEIIDSTCVRGVGRGAFEMNTCEHQIHHINWHTYIWRTDMRKIVGDKARTRQRPSGELWLSLLYHATIGTVQSVDFIHSVYKINTSWTHVLKIEHYQEFWRFLR